MIAFFKNTLMNNLTIKILSVIIGYCLWSFLGNLYTLTSTITVPVCFYNVPSDTEISADPESFMIQLRGKKADLKHCTDLALHINAESLQPGVHKIVPNEEQLFLPKTINLLHYKPLMISLSVHKKNMTA